jgi:hypothetical protein
VTDHIVPEEAVKLARKIAGCVEDCSLTIRFLGFTFGADHDFKEFQVVHDGVKISVKVGAATSNEETAKAIGAAVKEVGDHPEKSEGGWV